MRTCFFDNLYSQDYDKILERDWLSQARFEH